MTRRKPYEFAEPEATPPRMWRSLDQKNTDPAAQAEVAEAEHPKGLLDAGSLISRRGFMTLTGATAAAVGASGCIRRPAENILPYARQPEHVVPGVPLHFASVTERRGDALGVLVTSHEGRPTKVEGNPEQRTSGGATDLWAQTSLMDLYDPDRAPMPAKREGEGELQNAGGTGAEAFQAFDAALAERLRMHEGNGGGGLRLLVQPTNSPTFLRLREKLAQRFPEARVHTYTPLASSNVRLGTRLAFGQPMNVHYNFHSATILALDSDFLQTEPGAVRHQRNFASSRRLEDPSEADRLSRLYVVEPGHTVTGSNADHRLRLPAQDVERYLKAICSHLARNHGLDFGTVGAALGAVDAEGIPADWIEKVAADLAENRGRSVVVVGVRQPARVHALVHALNDALGNAGRTVAYTPVHDADEPDDQLQEITELTRAMNEGQVQSLVILGGNPVYDAPANLGFADALSKVEFSVQVSAMRDETARHCTWHVPRSHELEAWGDQRAFDGTVAIQQPLIAPLWASRSELEVLGMVAGERNWRGHGAVRATFRKHVPQGRSFERLWRQSLHQGVVGGTMRPAGMAVRQGDVATALREAAERRPLGPDNVEVNFAPCTKLLDGRYANNMWLLELPENMSKVSWDNAALVSPNTAKELGVETMDVLKLTLEGTGEIEVAAFIMPGVADWTLSLALGWGRPHAGRYGSGAGFDVYPLRTTDGFWFTDGVRVQNTGRYYLLAQTQDHGSMEGRPIAIDGDVETYKKTPTFPQYRTVEMGIPPLWDTVDYSKAPHKWGMSIDLQTCTGCNACVVACQAENNIPTVGKRQIARGREMYWIRIDRYFVGEDENEPEVAMQPVACQHCENAPCENVCPVNATAHSPEGLNDMAYNRCIGTRYCANNCPYKVRRFNYYTWHSHLDDRGDYDQIPETRKMAFNPNVTVRMRGVMEKCTYCVQRIQEAKIDLRRRGDEMVDGSVQSACQQVCPSAAIAFGDLNDPESRVSKEHARDRRYKLLAEVGTEPRTVFLAKVRNPNPAMTSSPSEAHG